jgi:hypothetical protein
LGGWRFLRSQENHHRQPMAMITPKLKASQIMLSARR